MDGNIRITPDKEKVKSMVKMAETTFDMIKSIDFRKYPSNIIKEYYDVIRELMAAVMLLDGFKCSGEGAHKALIEYVEKNYKQITSYEISLVDDMRITRNKIAYDGFFVTDDYVERRRDAIAGIIEKLRNIIKRRLKDEGYSEPSK